MVTISGFSEARSETPLSPKDREGALATRLAYVITGDGALDEASREGLQGLSLFLQDHTAIEPDEPVGVDLETDSLALYPLIYWPMPVQGQTPSASALARLETYMRNGGLVVFDTRDAASNNGTNATAESAFLQSLLSGLSLPPLEEIPANHVVMRSFYLLQTLPGRYAQGKIGSKPFRLRPAMAAPPRAQAIMFHPLSLPRMIGRVHGQSTGPDARCIRLRRPCRVNAKWLCAPALISWFMR